MAVIVHGRISERHPEISEEDVQTAWDNYTVGAVRVPGEREIRIGFDAKERELETVGVLTVEGWLVYHALTPPTKRMRSEIDRLRRNL